MTEKLSMVRLSDRTGQIAESLTLAVTARALEMRRQGIDVIGFGAGEPDFPTPSHIVDAVRDFLQTGQVKYTPNAGVPELREAVLARLDDDYGLSGYTSSDVLVSCGAKHSIYLALQALCQTGDEVVFMAPYWVSYPDMVRLSGARPVVVDTEAARGFVPDPSAIEDAVTERTRAIIVNSPSNPTGAVYPEEVLTAVADIAERHDLIVISDEIYAKLVYGGAKHTCFAAIPGARERTLLVDGVSKAYSMTGWRIGWTVGPSEIIAAMSKIQGQMTSNPATPSQKAAIAALTGPQDIVEKMRREFDTRRRLIVDLLARIPGIRCPEPKGAFYVFPDVSGLFGRRIGDLVIRDSLSFGTACLEEAKVALVPGAGFGADPCVRLSYATSTESIREGMARIHGLVERAS